MPDIETLSLKNTMIQGKTVKPFSPEQNYDSKKQTIFQAAKDRA